MVARVNGNPILLKDIEAGYDSYFFEWSEPLPPSVKYMKSDYGQVLLDLIIVELIQSELSSRNLEVTQEDILKVENEIRKDYPDDEFDRMLIEEYIDLEYWREKIRHKLLWEKFVKRVLMPEIDIQLGDIQEYYYSNIEQFYIPERLVYLYLGSDRKELLKKAVEGLDNFISADKLKEENSDVMVFSFEMRMDQLPENFVDELERLEPGQTGEIHESEGNTYYALYVIEQKEEQMLKPHEVYYIIEQIIIDKKLSESFNEWIAGALESSNISINRLLLDSFSVSAD